MAVNTIEALLKAANSSPDNDSSVNMAKRAFLRDEDAASFFEETKQRMVRIREWRENSSATDYALFDGSGRQVDEEPVNVGKFIRIRLYASGKYDWVLVRSIVDEPGEFIITVKPSHDPTERQPDTSVTSHFFGPEAENNFCLQLNGKALTFYIIGLHEKQNTAETDSVIESARNVAIANVGYYSGLQDVAWKQVCANFLKTDEEKES